VVWAGEIANGQAFVNGWWDRINFPSHQPDYFVGRF